RAQGHCLDGRNQGGRERLWGTGGRSRAEGGPQLAELFRQAGDGPLQLSDGKPEGGYLGGRLGQTGFQVGELLVARGPQTGRGGGDLVIRPRSRIALYGAEVF